MRQLQVFHLLPQLAGVNPASAPVKDVSDKGEVAESVLEDPARQREALPVLAAALPWPHIYDEEPSDGSLAYKITRISLVP